MIFGGWVNLMKFNETGGTYTNLMKLRKVKVFYQNGGIQKPCETGGKSINLTKPEENQ